EIDPTLEEGELEVEDDE
ncbi:hypothetical protein A2U01_0069308, partial [Trifolium medium]|nr:hypothetical protein [Trifolium medium]